MTDKNLTNNEIIKALEYCKDCSANLNVEIIDLITSQRAEIERSEKENEILSKNADTAFQDGLNEAQDLYALQIKNEIKSEAVKEFADEFERRCVKGGIYPAFVKRQLENVKKEMVGEKK